jgi:hypothetical protein
MLYNVPVLPTAFANRFILGYPDDIIRKALHNPAYKPFFELICHGSLPNQKGETFAVPFTDDACVKKKPLNAEQLFEIIVTHPAYYGQPVRLIMCCLGYGPNSLAQQLADLLGVHVLAVNTPIWAETLIPEGNGRWILFEPRIRQ